MLSLEQAGHSVLWSHTLVDLDEQSDHIQAKISNYKQDITQEHYRYVVGCDGKYSRTRSYLNTTFLGDDYDMHFVLGDFELDLNISDHEVQYYVYPDTFFILVPIAYRTWRIVVKYEGSIPDQPVSVNEIQSVIARHFGNDFRLGEPKWISRAPFYNRVAGTLARQRIFIAGDAAHLFSPLGGTGMNTGIQDAFNLGWKLAYVYHGISQPSLLNSYDAERLPAIREAAKISDLSTQLITRKISDHPTLDKLAPLLANRVYLRSIAPYLHSGMAQRIAMPLPPRCRSSLDQPNNLGKLSEAILFLIDNNKLYSDASPTKNRFWCFLSWDVMQQFSTSSSFIKSLIKRILRHPNVIIFYCQHKESTQDLALPISHREHFVTIPNTGQNPPQDIVIVRPDGLVMYESSFDDCADLEVSMDANFHFLNKIGNPTLVTQHEEVF